VNRALHISVLFALLAAAAACREPLPQVTLADTETPPSSSAEKRLLRIAIAPMESAERSSRHYAEIFEAVGERMGMKVQFLHRQTYGDILALVQHGVADAALVCSGPFVRAEHEFGAKIIAVPLRAGTTSYHALLIVSAAGPIRRLDELRGRSFAVSDPLSTSGLLYPADLLRGSGESIGSYFSRVIYTRSHDKSIRAVADRVVDAASVSDIVFDRMVQQEPAIASKLRVILRSPPYGPPPLIVHPHADPALTARLQQALLHLHEDAQGRAQLAKIGLERFSPAEAVNYDAVRRLDRGAWGDQKR